MYGLSNMFLVKAFSRITCTVVEDLHILYMSSLCVFIDECLKVSSPIPPEYIEASHAQLACAASGTAGAACGAACPAHGP